MKTQTYFTLSASVRTLEQKNSVNLAKAHNANFAASTRQRYAKAVPTTQRNLLHARKELNEFIDKQRAARGLKPRPDGVLHIRRH